jgi:hypothetical protein
MEEELGARARLELSNPSSVPELQACPDSPRSEKPRTARSPSRDIFD